MRKKTLAAIASVPSREKLLIPVIESLVNQVDEIHVALNGYDHIPTLLRNLRNVKCEILDNSLGDGAKMKYVEPDVYYFSCDDDLVYPKNHCGYLIRKVEQYKSIVTLHGKRYDNGVSRGFRRGFTFNYHCLHTYDKDMEMHVGGSGVMCFDTSIFMPDHTRFEHKNMCDLWIALQAKEQGVKIMAVAHKNTYLRYLSPTDTIWQNSKNCDIQTEILRKIL